MLDLRKLMTDAMQANDTNGCWSDESWTAEGETPMTTADLIDAIVEQVHTNDGPEADYEDGRGREAVIEAYELMGIADYLPCNFGFADDEDNHNAALEIFEAVVSKL